MSEHVKRIVEESVRFIISISLIVATYLLIMVAGELYLQHQEVMNQTVQTVPEKSKEELKEAMLYHGTLFAWQDEEDLKWRFRDKQNRECKLFGHHTSPHINP